MMTRRQFRKTLGTRNARREGIKRKRLKSGEMSKPMRVRYAARVARAVRNGEVQ